MLATRGHKTLGLWVRTPQTDTTRYTGPLMKSRSGLPVCSYLLTSAEQIGDHAKLQLRYGEAVLLNCCTAGYLGLFETTRDTRMQDLGNILITIVIKVRINDKEGHRIWRMRHYGQFPSSLKETVDNGVKRPLMAGGVSSINVPVVLQRLHEL